MAIDLIKWLPCQSCGLKLPLATQGDPYGPNMLYWGPDPFAEEIHGDSTPVWECANCLDESAMEI